MRNINEFYEEILEKDIVLDANDFKCFDRVTVRMPMLLKEELGKFVKKYNCGRNKRTRIAMNDIIRIALSQFLDATEPEDLKLQGFSPKNSKSMDRRNG